MRRPCMMSMLETIAERHRGLPVHYVHGTRDGTTHAMGAHARALAEWSGGDITVTTFYEKPRPEDRRGRDYDHEGLITVPWLTDNTPAEAVYYLCGPRPFLRAFVGGLAHEAGVPSEHIRYEFFGPADEILAA